MSDNHAGLTDPELHEIKGAAAATANLVPVSDGAGGAPFGLIPYSALNATSIPGVGTYVTTAWILEDGTVAQVYLIPVSRPASLTKATIIVNQVMDAGAVATISLINSTGPSTAGSQVIGVSAAVGTRYVITPSINNTFTANTYLSISLGSGSTPLSANGSARFTVLCDWTLT